jgi:hypothetical protein
VDTDSFEEYTVSFMKSEVCGFRNKLSYIGKLEGGWLWDPKRGGKEEESSHGQWEEVDKKLLL